MSNQKISLRTVFARNFRAMKIWQKAAPQLLPSIFCAQVASKLTPLAGIFLSGQILNALAAGAPGEQIWPLVALTLGVTAGLAALTAALNRWQQVQQECAFYLVHKLLSDKKASMDFPDADSQRVADMLAQILQNFNLAAWGLFHVIFDFPKLCAACASILLGGAMAVSLFLLPVPQGGMVLLNSPVLVAGMLAAMVGTAAISSALENYIQRQWADYAARGRLGNRFFSGNHQCLQLPGILRPEIRYCVFPPGQGRAADHCRPGDPGGGAGPCLPVCMPENLGRGLPHWLRHALHRRCNRGLFRHQRPAGLPG